MSLPISLLVKGSVRGFKHSIGRFKKNSATTKQQKLQLKLLERELGRRRKHNQEERKRQNQLLIRELKGEDVDPEEYNITENEDIPGLDMEMMKKLRDGTKRTTGDIIKDVIVQPWYGLITSVVKNKRQKKIDKLINAIEWEKKYRDDFFTRKLREGVDAMRKAKKIREQIKPKEDEETMEEDYDDDDEVEGGGEYDEIYKKWQRKVKHDLRQRRL